MTTFLFDSLVFGPVTSRRLGRSLGINLLPVAAKLCNYDCVYCECGWSGQVESASYPSREDLCDALETRLKEISSKGEGIDSITFAGNGEPTLHPHFPEIVSAVIALRDRYFPSAKTSVLSNATRLHLPDIRIAVMRTDLPMLKLDAGSEETFRCLNKPPEGFGMVRLMENLALVTNRLTIQSLFVRGKVDGKTIDNTTEQELSLWLGKLGSLKPMKVIIYSIERETAAGGLQKIGLQELMLIADRVEKIGFAAEVY